MMLGMLGIIFGSVIKAIAFKNINTMACFFNYSQWLGLFGFGSYLLAILNMIRYFQLLYIRTSNPEKYNE